MTTYEQATAELEAARRQLDAMRASKRAAESNASALIELATSLENAMAEAMADGTYCDDVEATRARARATAAMQGVRVAAGRVVQAERIVATAERAVAVASWPYRRALHDKLAAEIEAKTIELAQLRRQWIANGNGATADGLDLGLDGHNVQSLNGRVEQIYRDAMLNETNGGLGGRVGFGLGGCGIMTIEDCIAALE